MVLSAMAKGAAPPLSEKRPGCTTVSNSPQNHTRGRGRCFFAVSTGGGLESIFVEEGSTVWAHYEKEDYKMIAGQDNSWVRQLRPNQKNMQQQVSEKEIEDELWQAAAQDTDLEQKEETGEGNKKKEKRSRAEQSEA